MTTTNATTAEQFGEIDEDGRFDLIDGEVIRLSPSKPLHGNVASRIVQQLGNYADALALGSVFTAEAGFLVAHNPDSVLCPDAAFVRHARLPDKSLWTSFFPFAPDIAVEVLSPSERRRQIERKVALYLAAGAAMVWLVDPSKHSITVHQLDKPPSTLREGDTLDGGEALPGFILPLTDLFR